MLLCLKYQPGLCTVKVVNGVIDSLFKKQRSVSFLLICLKPKQRLINEGMSEKALVSNVFSYKT